MVLWLAAAPAPERVAVTGDSTALTLQPHHRLRLPSELPDSALAVGPHHVAEAAALLDLAPLLLVTESRLDARDGQVRVLGAAGQALEGPLGVSYFALEPFPSAGFPAGRLRTVTDSGEPLAVVQTLEALVLERDEAFLWVVGLDPTAGYRVTVADGTAAYVLVASDLQLPARASSQAATEAWGRSRLVLTGGQSADLPPTDRLALTVAQTSTAGAAPIAVTLARMSPGKGLVKARPFEVGNRWRAFATRAATELVRRGDGEAASRLSGQCLRLDPADATCRLLNARGAKASGDTAQALRQLCLLLRLAPDSAEAAQARRELGKRDCAQAARP